VTGSKAQVQYPKLEVTRNLLPLGSKATCEVTLNDGLQLTYELENVAPRVFFDELEEYALQAELSQKMKEYAVQEPDPMDEIIAQELARREQRRKKRAPLSF